MQLADQFVQRENLSHHLVLAVLHDHIHSVRFPLLDQFLSLSAIFQVTSHPLSLVHETHQHPSLSSESISRAATSASTVPLSSVPFGLQSPAFVRAFSLRHRWQSLRFIASGPFSSWPTAIICKSKHENELRSGSLVTHVRSTEQSRAHEHSREQRESHGIIGRSESSDAIDASAHSRNEHIRLCIHISR